MRALPRTKAAEIYRRRYVEGPGFDQVAAIAPAVAEELVDTGVNMGPQVAARFLQRALNGFSRGGRDWALLLVDGDLGEMSRSALRSFVAKRGEVGAKVLLATLNGFQVERYFVLAEANPKLADFLFGWVRTRVAGL